MAQQHNLPILKSTRQALGFEVDIQAGIGDGLGSESTDLFVKVTLMEIQRFSENHVTTGGYKMRLLREYYSKNRRD